LFCLYFGKPLEAVFVVLVQEQQQAPPVHRGTLAERKRFAHKPSQSLPKRVVEAFHMVGLPVFLAAGPVLTRRHHAVASLPKVCVRLFLSVLGGDTLPQTAARLLAAVAYRHRHDLTGSAAKCQPNPGFVALFEYERPEFIQFDYVTMLGRRKRMSKFRQATGFF